MRVCLAIVSACLCCCLSNASLEDLAQNTINAFNSQLGEANVFKDILSMNKEDNQIAQSRDKRFIFELPKGLVFELKWSLNFPFESFVRYRTTLQFALVVGKKYASEILYDTESPTFYELLPDKYKKEYEYEEHHEQYLHRKRREAAGSEREAMYKLLENLLEDWGLPARTCLLRTICEVAEAPFEDDLLGAAINTLLQPSKGDRAGTNYSELVSAELHGRHNGSCHRRYEHCEHSVFDVLPFVTHELTELAD